MFKNPFSRESRVAVDLLNQTPYLDCVDGSYGDEDDDRSDAEHEKENNDVRGYHDSVRPAKIKITGPES